MIKKDINIKYYLLPGLILLSFLLRLITVYFVHDTHIDNEWNILLENLIYFKSYTFFTFDNYLVPSVYMPPIYPFFLYLVQLVVNSVRIDLVYAVIFIQLVFSTYSVYLFYTLNQNFFSHKLSLLNSFIFSIFPLNIYACGQISSINLQIFLSLLYINLFFLIIKTKSLKNIIIFSVVSALLILTRGEFILIFLSSILFIFFYKKVKLKKLIIIISLVFLVISPYIVRNYIHFDKLILVKSLGYNLWKGNNKFSNVEGYENLNNIEFKNLNSNLKNIEKNRYYEIKRDNIFLEAALENLIKNSHNYINLFFKKIFSYYFVDINSTYPNYYNPIHVFPIIFLSIISFPGLFTFGRIKKFENKFLIFYLFINLFIFSAFFILPRYKLIILPIQIILAGSFLNYLFRKIKKS